MTMFILSFLHTSQFNFPEFSRNDEAIDSEFIVNLANNYGHYTHMIVVVASNYTLYE